MQTPITSHESVRYNELAKQAGVGLLIVRTPHQEIKIAFTSDGLIHVEGESVVSIGFFGKPIGKTWHYRNQTRSPSPGTG